MGVSEYARKLVSVAVAALAASTATSADAQVIIGRGGGIGISIPGVGGVRLGAPGVYVRPYGMSRRVIVGPYVVLVLLEVIYSITDPPILFIRRFVPPLRLGSIMLDTSFIIVLVAVYLLRALNQTLFLS